MAIKITNAQSATVQRLLKCCCNWDKGFCILLDEPCPQRTSRNSIICKHFKTAVLPGEKKLHKEITKQNGGNT